METSCRMNNATTSSISSILKKNIPRLFSVFFGIFIGYLSAKNFSIFFDIASKNISTLLYILAILLLGFLTVRSVKMSFALFIFSLPMASFGALPAFPSIKLSYFFFILLFISLFIDYTKKNINEKKQPNNKIIIKEISERIKTAIDFPLFVFLLIIIASIFQSKYIISNPYIINNSILNYPWIKSISKIFLLLGSMAMYYVCVFIINSKNRIKSVINTYIFSATIFSLFGICSLLLFIGTGYNITFNGYNTIVKIPSDLPRILSIEQEPLFFGFYLLTILPVLYSLIIAKYQKDKEWKNTENKEKIISYRTNLKKFLMTNWILLFASIVITMALLLTQSRSAILGFMLSITTLLYLFKGNNSLYQCVKQCLFVFYNINKEIWKIILKVILLSKKRKYLFFLVLIILGFYVSANIIAIRNTAQYVVEYGIINPIFGIFDSSTGKFISTKTRLIMYQFAITAFNKHPILGIGYENYNFYSGFMYYYGLYEENLNWPEVNNYPLKVLAEQGIIGFLFFIFILIIICNTFFTFIKKEKDPYLLTVMKGYTASFIGMFVILLFSSNITKPYIWVSLAIVFAIVKISEKNKNPNLD